MTENKQIITIEDQLSFIKNFNASLLPVRISKLKTDNALKNIMLRQLYNRICTAKESFMCLIDNKRYHDAFLVAGHIFETCATISDIKDNDTKTQIEKMKEYAAISMAGRLLNLLEFDDTNRADKMVRNGYNLLIERFSIYGSSIIRDKPKKSHSEIVELLHDDTVSNNDLISFIDKSYVYPNPKKCVGRFYERIAAMLETPEGEFSKFSKRDFFTAFYNKYCEIKHSNVFAPELDSEPDDNETLNLVVTPMVWIFSYLQQYGLGKPMLPKAHKDDQSGNK